MRANYRLLLDGKALGTLSVAPRSERLGFQDQNGLYKGVNMGVFDRTGGSLEVGDKVQDAITNTS